MLDFKNFQNPVRLVIEELVLAVLFFVLVIEKPLMNGLIATNVSSGMAALVVGIVGFVILWLMERSWKKYGPVPKAKK